MSNLDKTLGSYIKFNKHDKKFPTWLEKQVKKLKEDSEKESK